MSIRSASSSAPAAEGSSTPRSIAVSTARAKPAQDCIERSCVDRKEQIWSAPAAANTSMPAERMPNSAVMPVGKEPTERVPALQMM